MISPTAYNCQQRFRLRPKPGRTNRISRLPVHYANRTLRLGEWAKLLDRRCADAWRDLKRGVPIGEVLAPARNRPRDRKKMQARLRRVGL